MPNDIILITHASIKLTMWIEQNGSEVDEVTHGAGVVLHVVHVNNRTKVPRTVKIKGTLPDKPTYYEFFHRNGPFEWKEELRSINGSGNRRSQCEILIRAAAAGETPVRCPDIEWLDF